MPTDALLCAKWVTVLFLLALAVVVWWKQQMVLVMQTVKAVAFAVGGEAMAAKI